MIWRHLALVAFMGVVPFIAHEPVTNISLKQVMATQRVKFTWDRVDTAHRYRVRIVHQGEIIASKLVQRRRAKFRESKFTDHETYTVRVRAKPNQYYTKAKWSSYTFTFFDIDHDNDLIADTDDDDDDNDGIPDTMDDNPYDVSGTVYTVLIEDNAFVNGTITIVQNDSVTWVNQDEGGHAVAANNGDWSSPPLQGNESYTHVFDHTGVFEYYDPTYPNVSSLTGTITVDSE